MQGSKTNIPGKRRKEEGRKRRKEGNGGGKGRREWEEGRGRRGRKETQCKLKGSNFKMLQRACSIRSSSSKVLQAQCTSERFQLQNFYRYHVVPPISFNLPTSNAQQKNKKKTTPATRMHKGCSNIFKTPAPPAAINNPEQHHNMED